MRARFVNEAFERKNKETARNDLLFPGVKEWLAQNRITNYYFEDGLLNTSSDVKIWHNDVPQQIKFGKVNSFILTIGSNQAPADIPFFPTKIKRNLNYSVYDSTSLKGLPKKINGYCHLNFKGSSLKYSPKNVGRDFTVINPSLTSMEGAPEYIGGNFNLDNNKITSLEGCPKTIKGNFTCFGPLGKKLGKNREEIIREKCDIAGEIFLFSKNYQRNKKYKENFKSYGGSLPSRTTHVTQGIGNKYTNFSRGYKLYYILKYIKDENDKGNPPTYTDIQKYNYEMNHGKGSYNAYAKLSDKEIEKLVRQQHWYVNNPSRSVTKEAIQDFKHQNRGFGSTNMTNRGSIGSKMRKIDPSKKGGGYTLNGDGYQYLEDNEHLFKKKEHK